MKNEIFVNDLIKWSSNNNDNSLIERIVWIDERYQIAFLIDIYGTKGFPQKHSVDDLKSALKYQEASKLETDPWAILMPETNLSAKDKEIRVSKPQLIVFRARLAQVFDRSCE